MQKLYCYVDETGQDTGSEFFVVVAVVSDKKQQELREKLVKIEKESGTGGRKWHKPRRDESEPLIRLTDMWAGCIRGYYLNKPKEKEIIENAKKKKCLREI